MRQIIDFSSQKKLTSDQGFTMLEVLVGILLATIFVLIAAQSLVLAGILRLKAQRAAEATLFIQQDLENIKSQAASYSLPSTTFSSFASVSATQDSITVASATNFNVGDRIKLQQDGTQYTISSKSGNVLTLNMKLRYTYTSGTSYKVTNITRCDGIATSATNGLGDGLRDVVYGSDQTSTSSTIGPTTKTSSSNSSRQYSLTKILTPKSATEPSVLKLAYSMTPLNSTTVLATLNTEVIPNAVFECPPK